jgi:hypothetical protein
MGSTLVSNEEFRSAMRPIAKSLSNYASAIRDEGEQNGHLPWASSRAMAELADQHRWSTPEWLEPARNAHAYGGFLTYLIAEHVSAHAAIIDGSSVGPSYAHMSCVRAVLEAVPIAHWLLDPAIGAETRIQRSITFRLHSANQQKRMVNIAGARDAAERSTSACRAFAAANRWSLRGGAVAGDSIPKATSYSKVALGAEAKELDETVWALACATQHANWFALADGLHDSFVRNDPLDPLGGVEAITVKAPALAMFAAVIFSGADAVQRARADLMGWSPSDELVASRSALTDLRRLVTTQLRGSP